MRTTSVVRTQENRGQAGYGKRKRKGREAGVVIGREAREIRGK